jgi:light-regulated signal transduction histidine kinase (bacteriophytochrome)
MGQRIDYLLQLSRISLTELHLQPVDLGGEAAGIAEEIRRREPLRPVRFTIQKHVQALADRPLILTVLHNLLDNAWKFTSGRDDASIEFGTVPSSDAAVCCFVRDNGVGFDPAYAGNLFEPFQRLHAALDFPGTGTGLASVRLIAERHGGHAWAEGAVGAGATFYFTLDGKGST